MRAIWKANLSFGLVNCPVKFYSGTEEHDLRAHQVHAHDGGKISSETKKTVGNLTINGLR